MRKIQIILILAVCLECGVSAVFSQNAKNTPLRNADVVEMFNDGLEEAAILSAIEQTETDFETSAKTLIELKKLGISEKILRAMLKSKSEESLVPNSKIKLPRIISKEIALITDQKRNFMKRSRSYPTYKYRFFGKTKSFVTMNGIRSRLRISDPVPEIEISFPSDVGATENLLLVKLTPDSGRRSVEIIKWFVGSARDGFRPETIIPITIEEIKIFIALSGEKYVLYRVKVLNPLPAGEYALVTKHNFREFYDFGIDE